MGLLDSILGSISGKTGASGSASSDNPILSAIMALIQQNGGVQGLLQKLSQGGLGETVSSWIGTGENKAVSGEQIQNALGSEQIAGLASKFGLDSAQISGLLSQYLPGLIDKLTPKGEVESGENTESSLASLLPSLLQGGLGQLFGGDDSRKA